MKHTFKKLYIFTFLCVCLSSCEDSDTGDSLANLEILPANQTDINTSYTNSKTDIHIDYEDIYTLRPDNDEQLLMDAIAYLDADGDGNTDVFMATGEFQSESERDGILAINDGGENFTYSKAEFNNNMPSFIHARKSIVSDFDNNGLKDIFVFDHGFDAPPYPGAQTKLILQTRVGTFFSYEMDDIGFYHGGAAADIDNDGDSDIFVGGFDPFFYINDGSANFDRVDDRFDKSIDKVFTAELIDIDQDGFIDLLVGAHERDGDETSIYWGSSTGAYTKDLRYIIPAAPPYGAILDFVAEDLDGDDDRDIVINRTRDGNDGEGKNFYDGRTLQLLTNNGERGFTDNSTNIDFPTDPGVGVWFPWLRAQDRDGGGAIDLMSDDLGDNIFYENDGFGNFTQIN